MSKKIIIASIVLAIVLMDGLCSSAQGVIVSTSFSNSSLASPRIIAMGGAYVAVADDANAVFLNPAGLGNSTNNDISANYGNLLADVSQQSIVGNVGLGEYGTVGFGYDLTKVNNIPLTDSSGNSVGTSDFYSGETAISYGYPVYDWLLLGAKVRRLFSGYSGYFSDNGEGYGLGVGFLLKPAQNFNVGLMLEDIYATDFNGSDGLKEKIAKSAALGLSYRPIRDNVLLAVDLRSDNLERNADVDNISIGGEFSVVKWLKIRLGELFSKDSNENYIGSASAGLGINLFNNLNFDYAQRRSSGMNVDSQYFSMGYKF